MFCISLDFELAWGLDEVDISNGYLKNLINAKQAAKEIYFTLDKYDMKATWACVGLLMEEEQENHENFLSSLKYKNKDCSPLNILKLKRRLELDIFEAKDIIKTISDNKDQEIASHTFSHIYLLEEGIKKSDVDTDIEKFKNVVPFEVGTIIFPRNQINENYLGEYFMNGFCVYRGAYEHWAYMPSSGKGCLKKRIFRLLDSYIPLTDQFTDLPDFSPDKMLNIPGTCFLRSIKPDRYISNFIKLQRIKHSMRKAAKNNKLFHLWWHPHNFGNNLDANIKYLTEILIYYKKLESKYGMRNMRMCDIFEEKKANAR